jgi:hypothetical protein
MSAASISIINSNKFRLLQGYRQTLRDENEDCFSALKISNIRLGNTMEGTNGCKSRTPKQTAQMCILSFYEPF